MYMCVCVCLCVCVYLGGDSQVAERGRTEVGRKLLFTQKIIIYTGGDSQVAERGGTPSRGAPL